MLKFIEENKSLSLLSAAAIAMIAFYYCTYDFPELWHNAHILVDILFQLSLAAIANLIFYIFQVYIPLQKNAKAIRPCLEKNVSIICGYWEIPFSDITEKYLKRRKQIHEFTEEDLKAILEQYRFKDSISSEGDEFTFGKGIRTAFDYTVSAIDELLIVYSSYLTHEEKSALIHLKTDGFHELLASPLCEYADITGIKDVEALDKFRAFQQKYIAVKEMVKNEEQKNG